MAVSLDRGADAQPLPLFGSTAGATVSGAQQEPEAKRQKLSAGSGDGQTRTDTPGSMRDAVFYVGGPVWAMDWCPAGSTGTAGVRTSPGHESQFLAVRRGVIPFCSASMSALRC